VAYYSSAKSLTRYNLKKQPLLMCGLYLSYNCFSVPLVVVNICQVVLQAIELFFTFYSKLWILGLWIWILCNILCTYCVYTIILDNLWILRTYIICTLHKPLKRSASIFWLLLVHIFIVRWSSNKPKKFLIDRRRVCEIKYSSFNQRFRTNGFL
jgi:hypothetical protein